MPARPIPRAYDAPPDRAPSRLRAAVLGHGRMGSHHARILRSCSLAELVGVVETDHDRLNGHFHPALVHRSAQSLVSAGAIDFAVIALPTAEHANAAVELAGRGVHLLIEKPLALTSSEARRVIAACESAGVHGAVGHVERFNPAVTELRRMLRRGAIGRVRSITTQRTGPLSNRGDDIGVVKDLATHDLDLVPWLADSPIEAVEARTEHRRVGSTEDLALIHGRLDNGGSFVSRIDRISPVKVRRVKAVGERGTLTADTVNSRLVLSRNGRAEEICTDGRAEPLHLQIQAFCALLGGDPSTPIATLDEGLRAVAYAEAVLESAAA